MNKNFLLNTIIISMSVLLVAPIYAFLLDDIYPFEIKPTGTMPLQEGNKITVTSGENFLLEISDENSQELGSAKITKINNNGYINSIYIEKKHRGNGFGKQLLNYAIDLLAKKGCSAIYLYVVGGEKNIVAVNLYKSAGFIGDPNTYMVKFNN